jgi:hypothetical protein
MLKVLKKFVNFMVLTISVSCIMIYLVCKLTEHFFLPQTVSKSRSILDTERLIEYLKTIDRDHVKEDDTEGC